MPARRLLAADSTRHSTVVTCLECRARFAAPTLIAAWREAGAHTLAAHGVTSKQARDAIAHQLRRRRMSA